ncbi:hypothetical protein [Geobacillus phage GR1]|nr:hypothetical protein [Geobacillus phage GR1]
MTHEARELFLRAQEAKALYKTGKINREQARAEIEPYINLFNKKSKEIAKKYNLKPKMLTFASFVR